MKALWLSDVHFEFLDETAFRRFLRKVSESNADCILVSGDIGQGNSVCRYLLWMEELLERPIYFVFGNHDYYYSSISSVRSNIRDLVQNSSGLYWLGGINAVSLTPNTGLIGHDGWGDGGFGDYWGSSVRLNDFLLIEELAGLSHGELLEQLARLGDEAAAHFAAVLPAALESTEHIIVLTHVPPFVEAAWYKGRPSSPDYLPFFACKAVGDVLKRVMIENPHRQMTVLCGHTHGGGFSQVLPNLAVFTGAAAYGRPVIQKVFDWR